MPPHLWPDHENFLQATIEKVRFLSKKWENLRFPLNIQKQKVFQLQGATPRPGALPLDPAGGSAPQTSVIGSRSARSPCPPLPNSKYAPVNRVPACLAGVMAKCVDLCRVAGNTV